MRSANLAIFAAILVLTSGQVKATDVTVPNGDFEILFKPSTTITASVSGGGWTQGVGPQCPIDSGRYNYSDGTTGNHADIPGWLGFDREGWIARGGTYSRDQTTGNLQGSVASQANHTPGGSHCYLSNSSNWGNPAGGLIISSEPVGTFQANSTYTLSIYAMGNANPVLLGLFANGQILKPTSSVSPVLGGSWQLFTRTYEVSDLLDCVGQPIKIVLGVDRDGTGNQTKLDDVSLSYELTANAINPVPDHESNHIDPQQILSWTGPSGGNPTYDLYFSSTDPDLGPATQKVFSSSSNNYDPDLEYDKKYYWRVDVNVDGQVHTGDRWTFTTGGKATDPTPANGQENIEGDTLDLSWTGDNFADSYKVYAGTSPPLSFVGQVTDCEYIGLEIPQQLTKYYWRVDEYIGTQPITSGDVWNFTTSQGQIEPPEGDLNGDWEVSFLDLRVMAQQWLDGPGCVDHPTDCADLVGNDGVDLADFAVLSGNMGKSVDLKINELMAINTTTRQDEYGEYDDWIEIYNPKGIPVDIGGMYLTDDLSEPTRWRIPDDSPTETTIDANGYLLIWADGNPEQGTLHANFSLGNTGEQIALFSKDGSKLIDSVTFDSQVYDVSFGRYPDASDTLRFFDRPTPRDENLSGYLGRVDKPQFSVKRGFYEDAFELTLACATQGAAIYYTLDSSDPTQASTPYTGPIQIGETSCVRAAAFKNEFLPSVSVTNTYIFVDDVITQPKMSPTITNNSTWGPQIHDALLEIPSISLVTPHTIPDYPYIDSIEVPVSIEMIFPDGKKGFQENAGVERFGGQWTVWPKQALRVSFKGIYGASRLKYDLFSDTPYGGDDATDSFNQILLRQCSHDSLFYGGYTSKGVYTRNRYCFDRQIEMGHLSMRGKFVHMYRNGTYWGLYHLMERPTADFMASYEGGAREDFDIVKGRGGFRLMEGERTAWDYMQANTGNYEIVKEYMDVDNYIDYMLLNFYGGNDHDWYASHNWVAGRKRLPGGKFRFFMWDNDFLFRDVRGRLDISTLDNGGPGNMFPALSQHEEFRVRMGDRAQKHFFNDGILSKARIKADFTELTNRIERVVIPECARWLVEGSAKSGITYTPDTLQQSVNWIKTTWVNSRTDTVIQQMRDEGVFPGIDAPVFNINGSYQHGGYISAGDTFTITNPNGSGTIYYTLDGSDPRLTGGSVNPAASTGSGSVTLNKSTSAKARIKSGSTWSALNEAVYADNSIPGSIRISEIMYNPTDPNTEFIEIKNIGSDPVSLNLVKFTRGIDFTFGDRVLPPDEYVVVVRNSASFQAEYPAATGYIAGQYEGRLDNDGDRIELQDALGAVIHNFKYEDNWYELTDGSGYSLTVVDPADTDPDKWDQKFGWRSSLSPGGTPGYADTALAPDSIVINEVLAHSHGNDPDWIELFNTTGQEINIGGWYLSDDDSDPNTMRKYRIPDNTTIKGGKYLLFVQDVSFGNPAPVGSDIPFGLSEGGETVYLYSGQNGEITGYYQTQQKFDASDTGISFGRYEKPELSGGYDFVRQASQTPGFPNTGPLIADIVITEIHYNPTLGSGYEFVELYNRTGSPITLETTAMTETSPGVFVAESVPWRLEGTGYEFPAGVTIDPHSYILVAKDPSNYGSAPCDVYGPYDGKLNNGGEEIALQMPGDREFGKERFWIPVEKIDYDNAAPWPTTPDGTGDSLNRINIGTYGRDYSNWNAAPPTPGN